MGGERPSSHPTIPKSLLRGKDTPPAPSNHTFPSPRTERRRSAANLAEVWSLSGDLIKRSLSQILDVSVSVLHQTIWIFDRSSFETSYYKVQSCQSLFLERMVQVSSLVGFLETPIDLWFFSIFRRLLNGWRRWWRRRRCGFLHLALRFDVRSDWSDWSLDSGTEGLIDFFFEWFWPSIFIIFMNVAGSLLSWSNHCITNMQRPLISSYRRFGALLITKSYDLQQEQNIVPAGSGRFTCNWLQGKRNRQSLLQLNHLSLWPRWPINVDLVTFSTFKSSDFHFCHQNL